MVGEKKVVITCSQCGVPLGGCNHKGEGVVNNVFKGTNFNGKQIMETVSAVFNEMTQKIDTVGSDDEEAVLLRQRARLVAEAPVLLESATDYSDLNPELIQFVKIYSGDADRVLGNGGGKENGFGLRRLMIPKDHEIGQPSALENLITDFF